jgi:hypothetical protein
MPVRSGRSVPRTPPAARRPDPPPRRSHARVRLRAELLAHERGVHLRGAARGRPVAGPRERAHEAEGGSRRERVRRQRAPPPVGGLGPRAARLGRAGEAGQRPLMQRREAPTRVGRPALELRRVGEVDAVEKGAAVVADGRGVVPRRDRRLEVERVARHDARRHVQRGRLDQGVGAELAPERVERLIERRPRPRPVGLRPEPGEQPVAAHARRAAVDEEHQDRHAPPLGRRPAHHPTVPGQGEAAQGPDLQHLGRGEREVGRG